jgi:hypothetical protein
MFHVGPIYLREISVNTGRDSDQTVHNECVLRRDLLFAMETARSRLAVAIAEESKSTPVDRRRHYMDTADRIQLHIRKLRDERDGDETLCPQDWIPALEELRKISLKDGAQNLCECICRIMTVFE